MKSIKEKAEETYPKKTTAVSDLCNEKFVEGAKVPSSYQFMRLGYFCLDKDSTPENLIFNRSVSLKDGFKKK